MFNVFVGREKYGNRGKFIGSNLAIFCYKELEKFALCKSVSQSEATFIVYAEPIKSGHVKINFSQWQNIQNVNRDNRVKNLQNQLIFHNQTSNSHFSLKSSHRNERGYYVH